MSDQAIFNRPFIGYDGSKNSQDLITVFKRMHSKFEVSTIAFVWNPMKNFIPPAARGPGIQKQIRQKTEGLSNIDIKIFGKQQGSTSSTNQIILNLYHTSKSSFLMLGYYGSKGQKVRSIDLSSRIRQFVYDSKIPVTIVKRPDQGLQTAIFCCDGSQVSYEGLKKAISFCKKFNFSLSVVYVYNQQTKTYSKQVKNQLKAYQDLAGESLKIQILIEKGTLLEYLNNHHNLFQWIILTKNGYRGQISKKSFIGSNTTQVLTKVNSNIIIL